MISGEKWMFRWRSRGSSSKTASLVVIDGGAESTVCDRGRRGPATAGASPQNGAEQADRNRGDERQETVDQHRRDDGHLRAAEGHERAGEAELDDADAAGRDRHRGEQADE